MGLLDDAIREHLDLKRRRGADPAEVERAEREALGPVRREPPAATADPFALPEGRDRSLSEPPEIEPGPLEEPAPEAQPAPKQARPSRRFFGRRSKPADSERDVPADTDLSGAEAPLPEDWDGDEHDYLEDEQEFAEPEAPTSRTSDRSSEPRPAPPSAPIDEASPVSPERDDPPETSVFTSSEDELMGSTVEYDVEPELRQGRMPRERAAGRDVEPPSQEETDELEDEPVSGSAGQPRPDAPGDADEDVLEETPEFLQDTPDHDRLWFEQKPPRDFDFDE